ncbi:MAG: amidohydrolase [Gemmatimonadales bacterium]
MKLIANKDIVRLTSHVSLLTIIACGGPTADLLLLNGTVYTLTWSDPALDGTPASDAPFDANGWHADAEAIAVADGRIIFVGSDEEAEVYRSDHTWVKDLGGATVIPGLVDSHTHVARLGANLNRVDLRGAETEAEAVARVVGARSDAEPGEWIIAYGWDEGAWANRYPTMDLLSEHFPNNPVVMESLHSFATWGNRMAFERAGITASTAVPSGGEIVKNRNGNPTGILLNRAGDLLLGAVPAPDHQQTMENFHAGLVAMATDGYVAVHDAGLDAQAMAALETLESDGELPIRVYAMLSARDTVLLREWLVKGPDTDSESMLRTRSVKAFFDGALGSRGARLLEDYSDRPDHRGTGDGEYGFDAALVAEMMRDGFQVAIHAIGDAGNRETLDFIEGMIGQHPAARDNRHRIEHAQVVHPDDMNRFAAAAIIASMEPSHAVEDMRWAEDRVGPTRILGAYAWRTLREAGTRLVFNSDLTGSDHNIFYGLHAAITRRNKELEPTGGWYAEQVMTSEEAVRGYTTWAAFASFLEDETGVIAEGRWADITVMDIDPFELGATAPERILDGSILLTIVSGEVVYERIQ